MIGNNQLINDIDHFDHIKFQIERRITRAAEFTIRLDNEAIPDNIDIRVNGINLTHITGGSQKEFGGSLSVFDPVNQQMTTVGIQKNRVLNGIRE